MLTCVLHPKEIGMDSDEANGPDPEAPQYRGLVQDAVTAFTVAAAGAGGVDAYHVLKDKIAGPKDEGPKVELPPGVDPD